MNELIDAALAEIERRYQGREVRSLSNSELLELVQLLVAAQQLVVP